MRQFVALRVERGVIRRLVEPRAPDHDRGVVAVPHDHLPDVAGGQRQPRRISQVTPAWRLLPGEQPELIAGVEEGLRLRVVRAAHHGAVQLPPDDLGVPGLDPGGHRAPGEREELVPVDAEQLHPPAVEVEPVQGERGLAEPDPHPVFVPRPAVHQQRRHHVVELGLVHVPQGDPAQPGQRHGHRRLARRGECHRHPRGSDAHPRPQRDQDLHGPVRAQPRPP